MAVISHVLAAQLLCSTLLIAPAEAQATGAVASAPTQRSDGETAFAKVKELVGEWHAPEGQEVMVNIFRPIAFGTAILHEEWKRGEQLTATVFYLVGPELRADHFCDYKNQPRYVVKLAPTGAALTLEFLNATNLDVYPRHFHSTTWTFLDANHHRQDWRVEGGGREPKRITLEFTRKK